MGTCRQQASTLQPCYQYITHSKSNSKVHGAEVFESLLVYPRTLPLPSGSQKYPNPETLSSLGVEEQVPLSSDNTQVSVLSFSTKSAYKLKSILISLFLTQEPRLLDFVYRSGRRMGIRK